MAGEPVNLHPAVWMTLRRHSAAGMFAGALAVIIAGTDSLLLGAVLVWVALLGALLPDIDHPGSAITRITVVLHPLFRWSLSNPLTWLLVGRSRAARLAGHRNGIAHSLLGAALSAALMMALSARVLRSESMDVTMLPPPVPRVASEWFLLFPLGGAEGPYLAAVCFAWLLGYLSHLVLDMLTPEGVALMAPFTSQRFYLLPSFIRRRVAS